MVNSISNILPINVVGTISGTTASGTPTSIFSLAAVQNVVIVTEDPLEVNLVGDIVAPTGTFSESLTISGVPVPLVGGGGGGASVFTEAFTNPNLEIWNSTHGLGLSPIMAFVATVYDQDNNAQVIPSGITAVDANNVKIEFASPVSGTLVVIA